MNFIDLNGTKIHFDLKGDGETIFLLHGYLENLSIWRDYSDQLSKKFQVVSLDLPGHGKSQCSLSVISMDFIADCVNSLMEHLNISKSLIVGHSMGGYAALAFAENYPGKLAGLCLFHSTPNADSNEKIASREKDIDLVMHGRSEIIINRNIPNLYANDNLNNFSNEIRLSLEIAKTTSDKGIVGTLRGMADRSDRNSVLENLTCPTLMIFGVKDNLIPYSVAESLSQRHKKTQTVFLNNSGHMGFIEERDQALKAIMSFANAVFL